MPNQIILLDTTPLGLVTHPNPSAVAVACKQWLQSHIAQGSRVIVPEIVDYELRRELLRANRTRGVFYLDLLIQQTEYLPITTQAMRQAAQFWAAARQQRIIRLMEMSSSPHKRLCSISPTSSSPRRTLNICRALFRRTCGRIFSDGKELICRNPGWKRTANPKVGGEKWK